MTCVPTFTVDGERIELDRESVEHRLEGVLPEPIHEHYVVIGGRRFPPKQVLSELTGLDRADFTTHQARRILRRLGFVASRRERRVRSSPELGAEQVGLPLGGRQAEALGPFVGKWVALGEPDEILVAADTLEDVVAWLVKHDQRSSGILRVPRSAAETELAGPLP